MQMSIQVLRVEVRRGVSRKTGQPYQMAEAQCVFYAPHPDTGELQPSVGTMLLPRGQEDVPAGNYDAAFTLRSNREGRVEAVIAKLVPSRSAAVSADKGRAAA